MEHKQLTIQNKVVQGYSIPAGAFNIVCIITEKGMVGCGAFDVVALEKFSYPAVKVKAHGGISTIEDILTAKVVEANAEAVVCGVENGMTGAQAALKL